MPPSCNAGKKVISAAPIPPGTCATLAPPRSVRIASSAVIGFSLFGVMVSGQLMPVCGYPLEVALSVHNLAAFVCGFVFVQVDWLGAHRTGKLLFPRSVGSIHGSLPPFEGETLSHQYDDTAQFYVE
jgi:hypothetical protein